MFLAIELHMHMIYVYLYPRCLIVPSKLSIRGREIVLHAENVVF